MVQPAGLAILGPFAGLVVLAIPVVLAAQGAVVRQLRLTVLVDGVHVLTADAVGAMRKGAEEAVIAHVVSQLFNNIELLAQTFALFLSCAGSFVLLDLYPQQAHYRAQVFNRQFAYQVA